MPLITRKVGAVHHCEKMACGCVGRYGFLPVFTYLFASFLGVFVYGSGWSGSGIFAPLDWRGDAGPLALLHRGVGEGQGWSWRTDAAGSRLEERSLRSGQPGALSCPDTAPRLYRGQRALLVYTLRPTVCMAHQYGCGSCRRLPLGLVVRFRAACGFAREHIRLVRRRGNGFNRFASERF
jgi:hypothetical protein